MDSGINWEDLPWAERVRILDAGEQWVAIEKPQDVLSHPNDAENGRRAVLKAAWDEEEEAFSLNERLGVGLCHRLDAPTSGVLLLACGKSLEWFRAAFEEGRMRKKYWAVAIGRSRKSRFVWKDRDSKQNTNGTLRASVADSGKIAETEGREVGFRRTALPLSLLELFPATGRTHQIRVQAAKHGIPILGDRVYGDFRANRAFQRGGRSRRLFLHAKELSWKHDGKVTVVRSPIPREFSDVFPELGER